MLAGITAALLLAEIALKPFAATLNWFNTQPVAEASPTILTLRQFEEGIATAHYTPSSQRLTGIAPVTGAPNVLILGDSFVFAAQVSDRETMGAQLEQLSAQRDHPLNAVQYGWIAASPAKYVIEAPDLRARWNPAFTVIIVNPDDFLPEVQYDRWTSMQLNPEGSATIHRVDANDQSRGHALVAKFTSHSALAKEVLTRFSKDIWPNLQSTLHPRHVAPDARPANAPNIADFARAHVAGLREAYGDRLLLIYAAEPGLDNAPDLTEQALLAACQQQFVHCLSTREASVHARDTGQFLAAGFANSQPGTGHYNADGHRMIAQAIWDEYQTVPQNAEAR
jgi:hypothetical protein